MTREWFRQFVPLHARDDPREAERYRETLVEGIPPWLRSTVGEFLQAMFVGQYGTPRADVLKEVELFLCVELDWSNGVISAFDDLQARVYKDDETFGLNVIDLTLGRHREESSDAPQQLDVMMTAAGSAWTVQFDSHRKCWALERRVEESMRKVVSSTLGKGGRPAEHLRIAWTSAFGRTPNPSHGYREAVRAVEAVLIPLALPTDRAATLGRVIGEIRANPKRYGVRLRPDSRLDPVATFADMLGLLWTSQYDRHASGDEAAPLSVTQQDAEDAITLAVTVVRLVQTGAFHRID